LLWRYDFGENLDLSRFIKQMPFLIKRDEQTNLEIYVANFRITVKIVPEFVVDIWMDEIVYSDNRTISYVISFEKDIRFNENQLIQHCLNNLNADNYISFHTFDINLIINELSNLIKLTHKIEYFKAFI
jgi:hypothetical protein